VSSSAGDRGHKEKFRGSQLDIANTQELLAHVLTHHWADRFSEIERPALILLDFIAELVEDINKSNFPLTLKGWPPEL
jgi:hypothetical protein